MGTPGGYTEHLRCAPCRRAVPAPDVLGPLEGYLGGRCGAGDTREPVPVGRSMARGDGDTAGGGSNPYSGPMRRDSGSNTVKLV